MGRMLLDRLRCVELYDFTAAHDADALAEFYGFGHVVGDKDDGHFKAFVKVLDELLQLIAADGIEGAERLIHEEDVRFGHDGPQYADPLLFAAGKVAGIAVHILIGVEADQRQVGANRLLPFGLGPALHFRDDFDVFIDRQIGKEGTGLEDVADVHTQLSRLELTDVAPVDEDRPFCRRQEAVDHL